MIGFEQRLAEISRRRTELVARSAVQRAELGDIGHAWRVPMAIVDQGVTVWRFFRAHPALLVGLGVAFAVARPRRAVKWLGRGWTLWRFFRGMAARLGKQN
jgi:hypothetical protein